MTTETACPCGIDHTALHSDEPLHWHPGDSFSHLCGSPCLATEADMAGPDPVDGACCKACVAVMVAEVLHV